ncbi:hypothetical protein TNCV_2020771 [Trichonephila clavipes]|nr:hypothetical protein TNCV_2020771 [Trichonephila clavipes]
MRQTVERRALLLWRCDVIFSSFSYESETETKSTGRGVELVGLDWDEKMDGDCKAKLAAGTVGFEAGVSLFTDPNSDVGKCI